MREMEIADGNGKNVKRTERTRRGQCGDPRFLDQAQKALESVRRIWGLDAPVKKEGQGGQTAIQVIFSDNFFSRPGVPEVAGPDVLDALPMEATDAAPGSAPDDTTCESREMPDVSQETDEANSQELET